MPVMFCYCNIWLLEIFVSEKTNELFIKTNFFSQETI